MGSICFNFQHCRWSRNGTRVTVRFVLGRPANDSGSGHRQSALVKEQAKHGDLVQFNFDDTYLNLTLKGIGALQWLTDYCNSTRSVEPNCKLLMWCLQLQFDFDSTLIRTTAIWPRYDRSTMLRSGCQIKRQSNDSRIVVVRPHKLYILMHWLVRLNGGYNYDSTWLWLLIRFLFDFELTAIRLLIKSNLGHGDVTRLPILLFLGNSTAAWS